MMHKRTPVIGSVVMGLAAYVAVLAIYGAVPFLMLPTLGQAVWSMGFAESMAHGPWYEVYARHIGLPAPAPMAFGLAGAWPASLLIRTGLHAADAYAFVCALWLGVALWAAYQIGRMWRVPLGLAWLGGLAWLSMPIVWAHAGYSMLSLGIALLAFYYLVALRLFVSDGGLARHMTRNSVLYVLACVVAVFMDGYTFVMFAFGASLLWLYAVVFRRSERKRLWQVGLPIHIFGFAFAYLLYALYVGKASFESHPLDFFRGWSLDPVYLAIPTEGMQWLADVAGLSQARSGDEHFGDGSVWQTTFGLPLVLLGLYAVWQIRRARAIRHLGFGFFLVGLFAFYLALGPTLKFNTTKPLLAQEQSVETIGSSMKAEYGVMPTGSAWIYTHLPAFNVMRATYRWSALGLFAFWLLVMLWLGQTQAGPKGRSNMRWRVGAMLLLIVVNLPDLPEHWRATADNRLMFKQIDRDLVAALKTEVGADEIVAFVPWQNDFLINYVAPAADVRTLNIGGDKNVVIARQHWPTDFRAFEQVVKADDALVAAKLLFDGDMDALIVPYLDTLSSAHLWPCPTPEHLQDDSQDGSVQVADDALAAACQAPYKQQAAAFLGALERLPGLTFDHTPWFTVIRLSATTDRQRARDALEQKIRDQFSYPMQATGPDRMHDLLLPEGWYPREPNQIWSKAFARLNLPVPSACPRLSAPGLATTTVSTLDQCRALLTIRAFGASAKRPVTVRISTGQSGFEQTFVITRESPAPFDVAIPLARGDRAWQPVTISVPQAISPRELIGTDDERRLGISLLNIELRKPGQRP